MILIKSIELKRSATTSSSSSVPDPLVYLEVDHEETPNIPFNDIGLSTTGRRFWQVIHILASELRDES